jgi:hypothetical protein
MAQKEMQRMMQGAVVLTIASFIAKVLFLRMFVFFLSQCGCKSSNFLNPNSFFTIFRQLQGNSHVFVNATKKSSLC